MNLPTLYFIRDCKSFQNLKKCSLGLVWEVHVHPQPKDQMILDVLVEVAAPGRTADWITPLLIVLMMSHKEQNGNGTRN